MKKTIALLSLALALASLIYAETPVVKRTGIVVVGPSGKRELSFAEIAKMPRAKVTIQDHGKTPSFEGTELRNIVTLVGAPAGETLRGKELMKYVVVEGADGYRALFALPELDPAFSDRKIILADKRDGVALSGDEGPLRIAVEGEKRPARCVRQVVRISVVAAP